MRLAASQRAAIVTALGTAQTIGWASSYYLPAVLATPMASTFGISPVWIFAAFSGALIASGTVRGKSGCR